MRPSRRHSLQLPLGSCRGAAPARPRPMPAFLGPFLKRHGIAAVDQSARPQSRTGAGGIIERRVCARRGHRAFRCHAVLAPAADARRCWCNLIAAFDAAPAPLLLKCSGGQDRTSFAAALYLLHTKGWGAEGEARAQFARWPYLHLPKTHQRWLKAFVDFAKAGAGRPLAQWLRETYTSEALRTWLVANGLGDSFRGLYADPGP